MESKFIHSDLELIEPSFGSRITDLIIELDYLRKTGFVGSTHPKMIVQLQEIFHTLEGVGTVHINKNTTTNFTVAKFENESFLKTQNIEKSITFLNKNIDSIELESIFIKELHKDIVKGLIPHPLGKGDQRPGFYRNHDIKISNTLHKPPTPFQIDGYMEELFNFIRKKNAPKYDLLKIALAHHRFLWLCPFANGNGRAVQLFTYAMLLKKGFNIHKGRIVNPMALFCNTKNLYYRHLSKADTGTKNGLLKWCEFALESFKTEIEKKDRLLDYKFLSKNILSKAILLPKETREINDIEFQILQMAVKKQVFQASDLKDIFKGKHSAEISRHIKKLKDKGFITSEKEKSRKYMISFQNKILLKGITKTLNEKGFSPIINE